MTQLDACALLPLNEKLPEIDTKVHPINRMSLSLKKRPRSRPFLMVGMQPNENKVKKDTEESSRHLVG